MVYINARARTDSARHAVTGAADLGELKMVDLIGTKKSIWEINISEWHPTTLDDLFLFCDMPSRELQKSRRAKKYIWARKYHQLCLWLLRDKKYGPNTKCLIARLPIHIKAIKIGKTEWRIRRGLIHKREK